MRRRQAFRPGGVYRRASLFLILAAVQNDDFIESHAVPVMLATILTRAEKLAIVPENGPGPAAVADVARKWVARVSYPFSSECARVKKAQLSAVASGLL